MSGKTLAKPLRSISYSAVDQIVDFACKVYLDSTGKHLDAKGIKFIKAMLISLIEISDDALSDGKITPKDIAMMALKRAVATGAILADDKSSLECGVALASLAISTADYYGLLISTSSATVTGVPGAIGVTAIVILSSSFLTYQVYDTIATCDAAFSKKVETAVAPKFNVSSKREMAKSLGNSAVCKVDGS